MPYLPLIFFIFFTIQASIEKIQMYFIYKPIKSTGALFWQSIYFIKYAIILHCVVSWWTYLIPSFFPTGATEQKDGSFKYNKITGKQFFSQSMFFVLLGCSAGMFVIYILK